MAIIAIRISAVDYEIWQSPKFLVGDYSFALTVAIACLFIGLGIMRGMSGRNGSTTLRFSLRQVQYLKRTYRVLFVFTVIGYVLWVGAAYLQGVGIGDLTAIFQRELGSISNLKSNSRPIGGLTTLTQFGPVVVVLGVLLHKMGCGGRSYLLIFGLSLLRVFFYAERLALIELLVPYLVVSVLLVRKGRRVGKFIRLAPIVMVPVVWVVFAVSEYTRSWVYYQEITDLPFMKWATLRLLGYYTTSFNHSALFADAYGASDASPYFSVRALWDAPVLGSLMQLPVVDGIKVDKWWPHTLYVYSNPEFNNAGSFLVTYAEFGLFGMGAIWLVVGALLGLLFNQLSKGSVPSLLAYPCIFVGILELPRFIYWTQGRAMPALVALVIIALLYPRSNDMKNLRFKKSVGLE